MSTPEKARFCTDRILLRDQQRLQRSVDVDGRLQAITLLHKLWITGSTLHVRFLGGTPEQQKVAREQAGWWTEHANIHFEFDDAPDAQIRVAFDDTDGAWSYVGTDNVTIPPDEPTMNLGFLDGGTAAHEFGHALGLAHEHQNPDGGIRWNEPVVIKDLMGPPNSWSPETIRHNVLMKYTADQVKGTTFDPKSIMLYFFPARWTLDGVGTEANEVLSEVDKSYIGSADAYPRLIKPPELQATELLVDAAARTPASIGAAGEEDLYRFTVPTTGTYVANTRGPTDLVMDLFGPEDPTRHVASDDDSGVGLNARIAVALDPGTYYLRVRHFDQKRASGTYTMKVRSA
jgi:hypothetical protein